MARIITKRHAKPTAMQLAERTYRRVLAIEKRLARDDAPITEPSLASLQAIGWGARKDVNDLRLQIDAHFEALKPILDHCARLLREKETLQRQLYAVKELKDAATSSPFIMGNGGCQFAANHRPNVRCAACGKIEISEENYEAKCNHSSDSSLSTIKSAIVGNRNTLKCTVCNYLFDKDSDSQTYQFYYL